jgi:predicted kinase
VVLDATWRDQERRRIAKVLAFRAGADVVELRCEVPVDVALRRIAERERADLTGHRVSREVARRLHEDFDPWPTATEVST